MPLDFLATDTLLLEDVGALGSPNPLASDGETLSVPEDPWWSYGSGKRFRGVEDATFHPKESCCGSCADGGECEGCANGTGCGTTSTKAGQTDSNRECPCQEIHDEAVRHCNNYRDHRYVMTRQGWNRAGELCRKKVQEYKGCVSRLPPEGDWNCPVFTDAVGTPGFPIQGQAYKKCGPDITDWMVDKLLGAMREYSEMLLDALVAIGITNSFLPENHQIREEGLPAVQFGLYATGPGNWNNIYNWKTEGCPIECKDTVTICRICVDDDIPEDIAFAFVGSNMLDFKTLVAAATAFAMGTGVLEDWRNGKPAGSNPHLESTASLLGFAIGKHLSGMTDPEAIKRRLCDLMWEHVDGIETKKQCRACKEKYDV